MPDGQDDLTTSRRAETAEPDPARAEMAGAGPDLAILIVGAAHALGVRLRRELNAAGFPVRQPHGYVLRALEERPLTLTALAELLGVTKQAVGPLVDELVELRLVERRPDPGDRRTKLLALTRRGHAARARAQEVSAALERETPDPAAVRAGLLAIIEAEGFGEDAAHRRARPVW